MEKSADVGMLLRESNIIYKNDLIANRKDAYAPGDTIELFIPKGNYVANLAKTKFAYRIVHKTDVENAAVCVNDEKAMFHVQYIRFDSRDVIPAQGDRSRPIWNALKERICDADKDQDDPMRGYQEWREYQFKSSGTVQANANCHMQDVSEFVKLTATAGTDAVDTGDTLLSDFKQATYRNVYRKRVRFLRRFGEFTQNGVTGCKFAYSQLIDPADSAVTYQDGEGQTFFSVSLGDLITEFATMNQVYMGSFTDGIRVSLRLVEPKYAMSLVIPRKPHLNGATNVDTEFVWTNQMSYRITDIYLALRKHELNPEGASLMAQLSQQMPIPYVTYQYQNLPIVGNMLLFTTTLNFKNYLGTVVIFTGQGQSAGQLQPISGVNYRGSQIYNQPVLQYNSDHFALEYSRAQVEVGNILYKQNTPPIANRIQASYLASIDAVDVLFSGKQYGVDFQEFIDRASAIFIPANSMGSKGQNVQGLRITTTVEFPSEQTSGQIVSNFQAHIFHIGTASVRHDAQSGILIE